jgi:hypothetical protein
MSRRKLGLLVVAAGALGLEISISCDAAVVPEVMPINMSVDVSSVGTWWPAEHKIIIINEEKTMMVHHAN